LHAELCDRSLGAIESRSRRDRYRVYLHLDGEMGALTSELGPALAQWAAEMILCDARLVPVWTATRTRGALRAPGRRTALPEVGHPARTPDARIGAGDRRPGPTGHVL